MSFKRSRSNSPSLQSDIKKKVILLREDVPLIQSKSRIIINDGNETNAMISSLVHELVQIYVAKGNKEKVFHVFKKKLCDKIPYFDQLLKNSQDSIIKFLNGSRRAFDVLIEWIHTDFLRDIDILEKKSEDGVFELHYSWSPKLLYMLLEELHLPVLMNRVIEVVRRMDGLYGFYYDAEDIKLTYGSRMGYPRMKKYIAELTAYLFREDADGEPYLTTSDLVPVMENKEFARDYLNASRNINLSDPRKGPVVDFICTERTRNA
ncbi:hypothetical protein SBOR_6408 [Sclerotinia borealis F-4128]|uniref:BTB domain-containing protein n=1 Tax=Sclerotinia borealis (strain F-4128) TaxID=1432307 RepID=W9C8X2_SCLBF|nr:hypothetical protein SBOR_6408 [Sclerotinia borealis F-4128]